jgi:AraC-like DNA-binding protein
VWERGLCEALAEAVEREGASRFLAEARVLEWAAARLFEPQSGRGRCPSFGPDLLSAAVRRALRYLQEHLDQPLDLAACARVAGMSPHHLSRKVGSETGQTLQQHLRRVRVDHACEALASGRMNVTEAALEVGYQSLSHFSKAFREETGFNPRAWLASRTPDA